MGRVPATARMYEFGPLCGGGNNPTSQFSGSFVVEWNREYNELLTPLPVGEGGLYRVRCPPERFRYRGGVVAIECIRYR